MCMQMHVKGISECEAYVLVCLISTVWNQFSQGCAKDTGAEFDLQNL